MSTATLTRSAGDFGDDLRAFLDAVPAAAEFDRDDLEPEGRIFEKRPSRGEADRRAIETSEREWF
jgi:hypothetical protein